MSDERGNNEGATSGERVASGSPNGFVPRRIYVASSWRNEWQPGLVRILRYEGHEVYDFRHPSEGYDNPTGATKGFQWSDFDPAWESWDTERYIELLSHPIAEKAFCSDWSAMEWADTGVLLLSSGRSAHIEAGYFVGARKDLHVLIPGLIEPELMYKMAGRGHVHARVSTLLAALRVPLAGARS